MHYDHDVKRDLQVYAASLGFAEVKCTGVEAFTDWADLVATQSEADRAVLKDKGFVIDPKEQYPWARSLLVAVFPFQPGPCGEGDATRLLGGFSSYYRWSHLAYSRVESITAWLEAHGFRADHKAMIPLKAAAHRAGVAHYGRNGLLHHPQYGSLINLQAILTDALFEPDTPLPDVTDCGDCRICVDACPTGVISIDGPPHPYRCLRYWQDRTDIPPEMRVAMGMRIQGCEICQTCCPLNEAVLKQETAWENPYDIIALLTEQGTARAARMEQIGALVGDNYARPGRLAYMAAIAAGNTTDQRVIAPLQTALTHEYEPVRQAAAWALGRHGAQVAIPQALQIEYENGRKYPHA